MINDNIIVRIVPLPAAVKGVTIPSDDGTYNIYINSAYSDVMINEILKHELTHVKNYDFDNFDEIKIIETRADNHAS